MLLLLMKNPNPLKKPLKKLDKTKLLSKEIRVTYADDQKETAKIYDPHSKIIKNLSAALKEPEKPIDKSSKSEKIKALEAKLKAMEQSESFKILPTVPSTSKSKKPYDRKWNPTL